MAETTHEYHHGDQDVAENLAAWRRFMTLTKFACLHLAVIILTCTLWFAVGESFWGGLIPGVILFAIGIWYLTRKPHAPEV